jgi:hypothetical protein
VHTHDTREHVLYDLDGRASHLAVGALLESLRLATTEVGCRAAVARTPREGPRQVFEVALTPDTAMASDPLAPFLPIRSVQRKPLSARPLTAAEKTALEAATGPGYRIAWLESTRDRWSVARLLHANTTIRMTTPEAFDVHRSTIEWNAQFSADRMPDEALGFGAGSLAATRWAMAWVMGPVTQSPAKSWARLEFLNTYLAGAWLPGLELDVVAGLGCAAHFLILADRAPAGIDDHVSAGRAMQRVWLTATKLGLQMQPETTPLIFAKYVREGRRFSAAPHAERLWDQARGVSDGLARIVGPRALGRAVFMARIGHGPAAMARSTRKTLDQLAHVPASLIRTTNGTP